MISDGYVCAQCQNNFTEGEVVALVLDSYFHGFVNSSIPQMSCVENYTMSTGRMGVIKDKRIFYNGSLFAKEDVNELPNSSDITVAFNSANNGHQLNGDLSGLAALTLDH